MFVRFMKTKILNGFITIGIFCVLIGFNACQSGATYSNAPFGSEPGWVSIPTGLCFQVPDHTLDEMMADFSSGFVNCTAQDASIDGVVVGRFMKCGPKWSVFAVSQPICESMARDYMGGAR